MTQTTELTISCLCGATAQVVDGVARDKEGAGLDQLSNPTLCHCNTCRHMTGLLCTSYFPIHQPKSMDGLTSVTASDHSTRYFCTVCGCHVFRSRRAPSAVDASDKEWEVATGVVTTSTGAEDKGRRSEDTAGWAHAHTEDTKDGGLSIWLLGCKPQSNAQPAAQDSRVKQSPSSATPAQDLLQASCHCGNVRFHITRPNTVSRVPRSNFPDLMLAYCSTDAGVIANPGNDKWWLRDGDTRYLAGTCACRSCRLVSGFEIQSWAFVPRSNIYFYVPGPPAEEETVVALDFPALPPGILQSYGSSAGVLREFCPRCGATVFWHDKWRPDLIDVSVGLLAASEGARAESWLDWWPDRVSFAEDTAVQREGFAAMRAERLVAALGQGLAGWATPGGA